MQIKEVCIPQVAPTIQVELSAPEVVLLHAVLAHCSQDTMTQHLKMDDRLSNAARRMAEAHNTYGQDAAYDMFVCLDGLLKQLNLHEGKN